MKTAALLAAMAIFALSSPARAEDRAAQPMPQPMPMTQVKPVERPPEIDQAESYFRSLKTLKARFIQTAADGTQMRGSFYLNRPGKLRFQYDPPAKDFIVADGLFIYFYDGQLGQQTNAPVSQTLADFLLRKELRLSGDLKVTKIMQAGGLMQMTIIQRNDPKAGSLTLGFKQKPFFEIKKWRVKDSQGAITEIELFDVVAGTKLDKDLFVYHDPQGKGMNR